jgi:hypothetical protein
MAGGQYTASRGGARCSFSVAVRFLELRDLAAAQTAPDVFTLDNWPNELRDLFWTLWDALESGRVHAYSWDKEIPANDWTRDRIKLEAQLGQKDILGFHPFIMAAAQLTRHRSVDVKQLVTAFSPVVETPVEPAAPPHKDSSEAPSIRSSMAITTSEAGHMGGIEAQKLRREAGELAWAADALQIAKDARAEDPHIFTKTICERIWRKCWSKSCPAPDEKGNPSRQLYRFIERHEAAGDIPKRTPYKERKTARRRAR